MRLRSVRHQRRYYASLTFSFRSAFAAVRAQLQVIENYSVGGSIPPWAQLQALKIGHSCIRGGFNRRGFSGLPRVGGLTAEF
jgi:hypothetical protein